MGLKKLLPFSAKQQGKDQRSASELNAESDAESDPEFVNNAPYVYEKRKQSRSGKTNDGERRKQVRQNTYASRALGKWICLGYSWFLTKFSLSVSKPVKNESQNILLSLFGSSTYLSVSGNSCG